MIKRDVLYLWEGMELAGGFGLMSGARAHSSCTMVCSCASADMHGNPYVYIYIGTGGTGAGA